VNPIRPVHLFWLIVLVGVWALFGMTGRGAWHPDEALLLGEIQAWRLDGVWPVATASPLYVFLTGWGAGLAAGGLTPEDGARLASAGLTLFALLFTALAGRALFGRGHGAIAALALLGAFGLMLRAHALLPGIGLLAAYALLLYGVASARQSALRAGPAIGLALVALLLLRGLPDLVAGLLIAVLPRLSRDWREPAYPRALRHAALWGLAALGLWLGLLALQPGQLIAAWTARLGADLIPGRDLGGLLKLLTWFTWPLWPLAFSTFWHERRRLRRASVLHPLWLALLVLAALALWPTRASQDVALPLLPVLALLAAHGVESMRRGAAQAFYWFGVLCFVFFSLAFWLYFAAIQWQWPAALAVRMARLAPDYAVGSVGEGTVWLAAGATLLWLIAIPLFPRARVRPLLVWSTGMALNWLLLIALFQPWAEENWGYRPLIDRLAARVEAGACIEAAVDPAFAAMLRQQIGERLGGPACRYHLGRTAAAEGALRWQGARPRAKQHVYFLHDRSG